MTKQEKHSDCCIICEQEKEMGLYLYTSFICADCERKMVAAEPEETTYKYFIKQLRKVGKLQIFS